VRGMGKRKIRDALLMVVLLAVALLLWLFLRGGEKGASVVVTVSGKEVGRYSLYEEQTVTFGDEDYNILQIKDGKASVIEANCGDHTCVRTGEVEKAGESIICLPHELVVKVVGGEQSEVDAVTG